MSSARWGRRGVSLRRGGSTPGKAGSRGGFCCRAPGLRPAGVGASALSPALSPSLPPPPSLLPLLPPVSSPVFLPPQEATASSRQLTLPLASLQTVSIPACPMGTRRGAGGCGGREAHGPGALSPRQRLQICLPRACSWVCVHTHGRAWKHTLTGSHNHTRLAQSHARPRSPAHGHRHMRAHSHTRTPARAHTHTGTLTCTRPPFAL